MKRLSNVSFAALALVTFVACDKPAGGSALPSDKQELVGNWSGGASTMSISASGAIKSHIVDARGATADVDGQIQSVGPTGLVISAGGSTVTIPLKSPPKSNNGKWTMVVAGIEAGDVTLVKN